MKIRANRNASGNYVCFEGSTRVEDHSEWRDALRWMAIKAREAGVTISDKSHITAEDVANFKD